MIVSGRRFAEVVADRAVDRVSVLCFLWDVLQVAGGEPTAEVDHLQLDPARLEGAEDVGRRAERLVPSARVLLLRADVEGDAVRREPLRVRMGQDVDCHLRLAAELARQGPLGARAVAQDAAVDARARRLAGDLVGLGLAVDGKERHAAREGGRDVALLLDGVAERDALRRRAGSERHVDLLHRGAVEVGAELGEQREDFGRRVRLHRVVDAAVGHRALETQVVLPHDVEVDDEARAFRARIAQEIDDTVGHRINPNTKGQASTRRSRPARWRRWTRSAGPKASPLEGGASRHDPPDAIARRRGESTVILAGATRASSVSDASALDLGRAGRPPHDRGPSSELVSVRKNPAAARTARLARM